MSLTSFLRARLDEAEWLAKAAKDAATKRTHYRASMLASTDRELRSIEARRRLIAEFELAEAEAKYPDWAGGYASGLEYALQQVAAEWADHPDYEENFTPRSQWEPPTA